MPADDHDARVRLPMTEIRHPDVDGDARGHTKKRKRPSISPLLLFSLLSFSLGVAGLSLSAYALLLRDPIPFSLSAVRCSRSEDTARAYRLVKSPVKAQAQVDLVGRARLLAVVGVHTGFYSKDRRIALRETWFPPDAEGLLSLKHATGLALKFVIGRTKDVQKMSELEEEVDKYKDFLLLDVEDELVKAPYKTLAYLKAAFDLFDAEFYVKADDDIYVRPDRLATLLAKDRIHPFTYIGCMKKGPVVTDPKLQWYEASGSLLGKEYFYHANGPIYALSAGVVSALVIIRNDSLRVFSNEDVTIGSWMLAMNVNHEDSRAMCDPRCTPTSIAVWETPRCSGPCSPADKLRELHKINMCSKSPTLPPNEK